MGRPGDCRASACRQRSGRGTVRDRIWIRHGLCICKACLLFQLLAHASSHASLCKSAPARGERLGSNSFETCLLIKAEVEYLFAHPADACPSALPQTRRSTKFGQGVNVLLEFILQQLATQKLLRSMTLLTRPALSSEPCRSAPSSGRVWTTCWRPFCCKRK